jgi:hypothetical protein
MIRVLFFFCLIHLATAHVPIFPIASGRPEKVPSGAFEIKDVTKKSWGVYGDLTELVWLKMEGVKGEEMTISLQRNKVPNNYDVGIFGPNLTTVSCNGQWYGWTHGVCQSNVTKAITDLPQNVQDQIAATTGIPELEMTPLIIHGDACEYAEFEPFGVGLYWPLGGCKATWPESAMYYVVLTPPPEPDFEGKDVHFSLGVGMEEVFTLGELIMMSFLTMQTFIWGQSAGLAITVYILVGVFTFLYYILYTNLGGYGALGVRAALVNVGTVLIWLGASFYVASAATFLAQLLWCLGERDENTIIGTVIAVTIIVHILIPLFFGLLILQTYNGDSRRFWVIWGFYVIPILVGLVGVYGLLFVWQGYIFAPSLIIVGAILHYLF